MKPIQVLLLCGGQSEEHDVSLASARSVLKAAGPTFEIIPMIIDRSGKVLPPEASHALLRGKRPGTIEATAITDLPHRCYDVVFPLLHGPFGEDGSVQGLLKLVGLPHVGSSILGSAVGMDKIVMKQVFAGHGFPQVSSQPVTRREWSTDPDSVLSACATLDLPLYVKPANLGSSVGISRVEKSGELGPALDEALAYDRRGIVEQGLVGVRELEVALLGNDHPASSPLGEIRYDSDFYDYRTKYTDGLAELHIPAPVSAEVTARCKDLARKAFLAIDAAGLARVDFFYRPEDGAIFLNEINTMPGFTPTSMYPKLWEAAGLSYRTLIDRLLELALEER